MRNVSKHEQSSVRLLRSLPRLSSLAQLPARADDGVIRGPRDLSTVRSTGGAARSRVSSSAHGQVIVSALGGERINCESHVSCQDGAYLIVAIVSRMVLALNAVAGHRATCAKSHFPSARRRRRGWDRCGGRRCTPWDQVEQCV